MNEITIQNAQRRELLPAPKSTAEAMELAKTLASSQLIPKAFQQRPGDVFVAMMWSHSLGIPIVQGLQGIAVINGKPSLYGDALLAVCMGSGQMADIEETVTGSADNLTATCKVTRRGKPTPVVSTFSIADARPLAFWVSRARGNSTQAACSRCAPAPSLCVTPSRTCCPVSPRLRRCRTWKARQLRKQLRMLLSKLRRCPGAVPSYRSRPLRRGPRPRL